MALVIGVPAAAAAGSFSVTYSGSGQYRTDYRSTSPNPDGAPDHNFAHDGETQAWSLRFTQPLELPSCGTRLRCPPATMTLSAASGATSIVARISHVHRDGLYGDLNASERCVLRAATRANAAVTAGLVIHLTGRFVSVTALNPLHDALAALPAVCPGHTDSIDGLADSYLGPGFSFGPGYGPDRWFTSATVRIARRRLRDGSRLRIRVGPARRSVPAPGCRVPQPSYESCRTGGRWLGVVTLTSRS